MTEHYTPSPSIEEKLLVNRAGKLTRGQRTPIIIAAFISTIGLICPATMLFTILASLTASPTLLRASTFGAVAWIVLGIVSLISFVFLGAVLFVNARMFLPEAFNSRPVRWEKAPLKLKLAERERPEMPLSYIIGDYSFAPFVAPEEVPLERDREYIVYYTPRSRLLLSIAPTDQKQSEDWLPTFELP
jgi:hypothetical protein